MRWLRSLPYRAADRLVVATAEMRQRNAVDLPFSGPDFFDLHRGANFLTLVGGAVVIGRTFTDADGQPLTGKDAGPPEQPYLRRATTVAVLSYDYWQRRC